VIYPSPNIVAQDTIHVYGYPPTPVITYDQVIHTISTPDLGYAYQWYVNGSPIAGATNTSHVVYLSGIYTVVAINPSSCVSFSDTLTAVYCNPFISPNIAMTSTNDLVLSNYPSESTIEWFLDGVLISNQNNDTIIPLMNGIYSAQITDPYGCSYSTSDFQLALSIDENASGQWMIYPNPVKDILTIQVDEQMIGATFELLDISGRRLISSMIDKSTTLVDVSSFPNGAYFLCVDIHGLKQMKKLVKE
jgi:hypothetical protein